MYNIKKNNFYKNEKKYVVYTPLFVSNFLYENLKNEISKDEIIFDPCVGSGNLLKPWKDNGYKTIGFDIEKQSWPDTKIFDYLQLQKKFVNFKPKLILINPPFNSDKKMRAQTKNLGFGSRPFMPEVFLSKTIELFGKDVKIILFTPYGFRLNVTTNSKRIKKFEEKKFPEIKSIISLPKDTYIFENRKILFHSEIILFNTKKMKPHYFIFK